MTLAGWSLFVGLLLISMVLTGTVLRRLPLSSAMIYLALGWLLGPDAANVLRPDPFLSTGMLERIAEIALLISLFSVGLQLGIPLRDIRWRLPLKLAIVSMTAMVALVALVGAYLLDLPLGAAVLLGAILAPTDPVLASAVHSDSGEHPDRLGFSLAGEGGLNDGTAYPFVMLGLALLGLHDVGPGFWRWGAIDVLWTALAGALVGAILGAATGRLVVYLRSRHQEAVGLDVFLGLGLVGTAYGIAQISMASGFLAVFTAGLALQRVRERPRPDSHPLNAAANSSGHSYDTLATHSHHASATMHKAVQGFNEQIEKLAEMALVLMVGAMLAYAPPIDAAWWFVPLMLLVLRPLSVRLATGGEQLDKSQRMMISWFGIRGIGSVFYLLLALRHGVTGPTAGMLLSLTLWTVTTSIVVHGITAHPFMRRYIARRSANPTAP